MTDTAGASSKGTDDSEKSPAGDGTTPETAANENAATKAEAEGDASAPETSAPEGASAADATEQPAAEPPTATTAAATGSDAAENAKTSPATAEASATDEGTAGSTTEAAGAPAPDANPNDAAADQATPADIAGEAAARSSAHASGWARQMMDSATAAAAAMASAASGAGAKPDATDDLPDEMTPQQAVAALQAHVDGLNRERDELREQSLRLMADMDNLRKRTEREKADAHKFAVERFARELLSVADNIDRAFQHTPGGLDEDPKLKAFVEGIDATRRQMLAVFEKFDVMPVPALGERLDPNLHEAVQQIDDPSKPDGTIVTVYQNGFQIAGRLLRPAMVVVATGGPRVAKDEAPSSKATATAGGAANTEAGGAATSDGSAAEGSDKPGNGDAAA